MSGRLRSNRYERKVQRDRDYIAAEERRARGEQTEQERWAADLAARVSQKQKQKPKPDARADS